MDESPGAGSAVHEPRGPGGRPRNAVLTERLLATAVDMLAEQGLSHLTFESLASRAGAGKAALYRRWPSMAALLEQAVTHLHLVGVPADQGSLRGDLFELLQPWAAHAPAREQRAAVALFSAAHVHIEVRRALFAAIVDPLSEAVGELVDRGHDRTPPEHVSELRARMLTKLVQAMWWERGLSFADPLSTAALRDLIDSALLPPSPQHDPAPATDT